MCWCADACYRFYVCACECVRAFIKFASRVFYFDRARECFCFFVSISLYVAIFWRASSRQRSGAFSFIEHFICWLPIAALKFLSAFVSFDIYSTPNHTHKNKTGCCFIAVSRFEWKFVWAPASTSAAAVNPFQGEAHAARLKLSRTLQTPNSKLWLVSLWPLWGFAALFQIQWCALFES